MNENVNVTLKQKVQYSLNGEVIDGVDVILTPPARKVLKQFMGVKSMVLSAIREQQSKMTDPETGKDQQEAPDDTKDENKTAMEADQMMLLIYSTSIDTYKLTLIMLEMFKQCAYIDGQPFQDLTIKALSVEDIETLIGTYIANFMMP